MIYANLLFFPLSITMSKRPPHTPRILTRYQFRGRHNRGMRYGDARTRHAAKVRHLYAISDISLVCSSVHASSDLPYGKFGDNPQCQNDTRRRVFHSALNYEPLPDKTTRYHFRLLLTV